MDRPLQAIQDTVRIPFYQTTNTGNDNVTVFPYYEQFFLNMIPQSAQDVEGNIEWELAKRQGLQQYGSCDFLTGIVNSVPNSVVVDAIAMTALYDVYIVAVFDTSNSTFYIIQVRPVAGTATKIGSFAPGGASKDDFCFLTEYSQSNTGSLFPAVAVSYTNASLTLSKGYYSQSSSGVFGATTLTEITDTNFPPKQTPALITTGRFLYMNGTIYIATLDGRICNSASTNNDITTWSDSFGPGIISANAYTDQLVGLIRYKHHVVAFGRNTIQFFDDVGNDPSPLQATQQAFVKFGAKSPRLLKNVNDILYWVSYGESGSNGLWMLDGYTPTKLSNAYIDGILSAVGSHTDPLEFNLQATVIRNKDTLIINNVGQTLANLPLTCPTATLPTNSDTYPLSSLAPGQCNSICYNISDKVWWGFNYAANGALGLVCAGPEFSIPLTDSYYIHTLFYQQTSITTANSGQFVYTWSNNGYDEFPDTDDSRHPLRPIDTIAQLNPLWFTNEKRKRINKLKLIGYRELASGDSNTYSLYIFYVKDLEHWNSSGKIVDLQVRQFSIASTGTYRQYLNNFGMGRAWFIALVERSNVFYKYKFLELDVQQGSH